MQPREKRMETKFIFFGRSDITLKDIYHNCSNGIILKIKELLIEE